MATRLKHSEIAGHRAKLLNEQGGKCLLCSFPVAPSEAVLDHCHTTGVIRAVLHRGCNAMLGHIENNAPRHGLTDTVKLARMLSTVASYRAMFLPHLTAGLPLHPTFKTDEEKRVARNAKARKARAKAKEK